MVAGAVFVFGAGAGAGAGAASADRACSASSAAICAPICSMTAESCALVGFLAIVVSCGLM